MEGLTQNEKIIWTCWEEKSPRDVVREAAAKGTHINLAVKYLMNKNSWNEATARDWFLSEVKTWTIQLLMRKQIFKVLHILNKVNINPEEHLMTLAETSAQIQYRDFIIENIEKLTKDIKTENILRWQDVKKHWNLLRYLEKSFESDGTFKQNKVFGPSRDRVFVNETEIKALTIENIKKYPPQWKSKIATTLFFRTFEFSLMDFSSPGEMWNHLVDENKAMILVRWINVQMSEVVRDMNARYNFFNNDNFVQKLLNVDTKGFTTEVLHKLDEIFRNWPITEEMIASVATSNCFTYTKMCIYDTLSSYGIVIEDERKNLYEILSRLARTQNLKLIDDIFTETCSTVSKSDVYVELAKYCVRNKLYKMLTICVEGNINETDIAGVEKEAKDCIELWLLFKSIVDVHDRQSHVIPVYKTCEQIAQDDVNSYISANPHLIIGMILLDDVKLYEIFNEQEYLHFKNFKLPNKGYKHKYPHLYNVSLKFSKEDNLYESKDVNVYQLLSEYRGLDVSKVFEFQLVNQITNNLIADKPDRRSLGSLLSNEDVNRTSAKVLSQRPMEMPNFADEKLMKKYGYMAQLNHIYYLKQYRPCNASQTFVAQQYQTYNRLQEKSIKSACCEAHALALQNWNDPAMAGCAISFVAMIGCNPSRCRVHMSAANMLKNYLVTYKCENDDQAVKIVNDYMSKLIQSNDEATKSLLLLLEEITLHQLKEREAAEGKVDIATILYESQTMVKFAMLHNLPLPEKQLLEFIKGNSWFNFLLYGDVFRYPLAQMLQLSQKFENSYAEHLKYIMLHKNAEEGSDKDFKSVSGNGQRRLSRLNSMEISCNGQSGASACEEIGLSAYASRSLWEVAAACHGPEDPPAALLRAADRCGEPLLVLVASCYEPNAVDILWAHWMLAWAGPGALRWDAAQHRLALEQFRSLAEHCLANGYVATLHESILVFIPESPLVLLTSFLCRCIRQHVFDCETIKLLNSFTQHCHRKYSVDSSGLQWQFSKEALQKVSVGLIKVALSQCFDSAYHQMEFLKCLAAIQFGKGFTVPTPNFVVLHDILQISMTTSSVINVAKMLQEDSNDYLSVCVDNYTSNENYDVALKIAKLAGLPINNILISLWTSKFHNLMNTDELIEDTELTLFIAHCSEAFKQAEVTFEEATEFLVSHVNHIASSVQRFYSYRLIMNWFEEKLQYGARREEIEHLMWAAYFESESQPSIFLNSYPRTLHFILHGQKETNDCADAIDQSTFSLTLNEIEKESDVGNIENVVLLEEPEQIDHWRSVIHKLMELQLLVEGFRLSALFSCPPEYRCKPPPCPVQIIRTCLKLAEGSCSPYELPQELRLVVSSPLRQSSLSISGISDASFEELVVIQEKQEQCCSGGEGSGGAGPGPGGLTGPAGLAGRADADRLGALDALAARAGLALARLVASYYRIALQVGWDYRSVLKYTNRSIDFINLVSGRARMSLANLVFRTFNIPSKQVAEYLCSELVTAIISPHLVKTSTFKQKEHFQYTLWGYALNSDMEMFLNMRPDACIHIGRLVLDHLMAFRKIYKSTTGVKVPENSLDDSCLDVDTIIDEEYQHIEEDEVSGATDSGTLASLETDSVFSASTVYSVNKTTKESRRNLFDVITKTNVHIRYEVISNVRKITKGAKLSTKQVNIICIELLVVAHECFSSACDTEGVGVAVRSAQALTAHLAAARSWRLMVRLLTGLARYTEMAYVLTTLRDNHQFEFLLGQFDYMLGHQLDKINEFKHALLDFLKVHCPGDTDTYIMVALHFNMYAEAASLKKKQAFDLIKDLEKMALDSARATSKRPFQPPVWLQIHDNATTRLQLETALNHSTDAAELYLQGGCTGFAGEMATLAQQIALQLSLLNASPTRLILNRSTEQTYRLISEYLSFMEGLVMGAHAGQSAWRELAYRRALGNDQPYLRDMALYRPDIAQLLLNRYKTEKNKTPTSQAAMTELKNMCR